ncbi:MAG: HAD-IIB family hydrolase [Deltaproteobacteria bacterium]|nr:HAD-IIB family hydrolase [Deltaproteobacteria bacterium]
MVDRNSSPPSHLVFSDLDGTLLDHHTYDWEEAQPALDHCRKNGVPVILVSSKTRAEMDVLRRKLNLRAPFVSENGGGIFFPREAFKEAPADSFPLEIQEPEGSDGLWQWSLGTPYTHLVRALGHMRESLRLSLKGFSEMDVSEISRLTGLGEEAARLASCREYDEPFIFEGEAPDDLGPLHEHAAQRGLMIVSGGRFHHLLGNNHKGKAMARIVSWYHSQYHLEGQSDHIPTIALGDSPNDFPMLMRADFPVLILSKHHFPDLEKKIPNLETTKYPGPKGWNEAILNILSLSKEKADA